MGNENNLNNHFPFIIFHLSFFLMPVARSAPNIAFIKYWGNRKNNLRLPAADSLSMTLDTPSVEITVDHAETFAIRSFQGDGSEKSLQEKDIARFKQHWDVMQVYLGEIGGSSAIPGSVSIIVRSHIPSSIGLASSAAVFACLAKAYAGLVTIALNDEQISIIARFGSGSAARSVFGGYSALIAGDGHAMDSSYGVQVADEDHWLLHDIIIVPTQEEKKVGSTEGHALAWSSSQYKKRLQEMPRRQKECFDAIIGKDFEKLQRVVEEDCWDMHNVMRTSRPSLQYLSDATYRITDDITELRERENIPVLFTMDAGPTVHLLCPDDARQKVLEFAHAQKDCRIVEAKTGKGAEMLAESRIQVYT